MTQSLLKREIIVKLRPKQREAIKTFYASRGDDRWRKMLRHALELPDPQNIHLQLSMVEVASLLSEVEDDYESVRRKPGQYGMILRNGMFTLRNTLALCDKYHITGDEL